MTTLLGGCDRVFQLDEISDAQATTMGDSASDAGSACFSDNFDANSIDTSKWTITQQATTTVKQSNGELVVTLAQASGDAYGQIDSASGDFTNDVVEVEVTGVPNPQTSAEAGFSIETSVNDRFMIVIAATGILWRRSTTNGDDDVGVGYVPLDHRYLRIRHEAGIVYWEWRGRTDVPWMLGRMEPVPATALQNKRIIVYGGTYEQVPVSPGTARFDNLVRTCRQ